MTWRENPNLVRWRAIGMPGRADAQRPAQANRASVPVAVPRRSAPGRCGCCRRLLAAIRRVAAALPSPTRDVGPAVPRRTAAVRDDGQLVAIASLRPASCRRTRSPRVPRETAGVDPALLWVLRAPRRNPAVAAACR